MNENALPTVFKWEGGGKDVFITGTFSDWKPLKMCSSHGDFVTIINVPEVLVPVALCLANTIPTFRVSMSISSSLMERKL